MVEDLPASFRQKAARRAVPVRALQKQHLSGILRFFLLKNRKWSKKVRSKNRRIT
jgi:hypothetical protein